MSFSSRFSSAIWSVSFLVVYMAIKVALSFQFENNWGLNHWEFLSISDYIIFIVIAIGTSFFAFNKKDALWKSMNKKIFVVLTVFLLLAVFSIFSSDHFIYNGGNHLINQVAQHSNIIYNWYEYGAIFLISMSIKIISFLKIQDSTTVGVYAVRLFSLVGVFFTLIASVKISQALTINVKRRVLCFIILFFGPQTLIYFGYIGIEPFMAAIFYWYLYLSIRANKDKSKVKVALLLLLTVLSIIFHIIFLILIPSTLFIICRHLFKMKPQVSLPVGLASIIIILALVFYKASSNFGYAQYILMTDDMNMFRDYNLFSKIHISDFFQVILCFFPQLVLAKYYLLKEGKTIFNDSILLTTALLSVSSVILIFITQPIHAVVLDSPRFLVYLAPVTLLVAYLLIKNDEKYRFKLSSLAWLAVVIPFSYIPCYHQIDHAEKYLSDYMMKNNFTYIEGGTAIQDSYFYNDEIEKANQWYVDLPVLSEDFMDITKAKEYILSDLNTTALDVLLRLKARYPYWLVPRQLAVTIYTDNRRLPLARAEIDTCMMIDPYDVDNIINNYRYYKDVSNFKQALNIAEDALEYHAGNNDIKSDMAIYYYRLKQYKKADSLSKYLIKEDNSLPYPHAISGFLAEGRGKTEDAVAYYSKFLELAPLASDADMIKYRRDSLVNLLNENTED